MASEKQFRSELEDDAAQLQHGRSAGDVASEEIEGADEADIVEGEPFDPELADKSALLKQYRELESQLKETREDMLRAVADAENFKKRIEREKEGQTRYANETIIRELLPVMDNLERALSHSASGADDVTSLLEGLNMTLKGFKDTLARFGCTPVEAVGKPFDPNFHEAVSQEERSTEESNTVVRELQKGYVLKERLLRPAMVVVSRPANTIVDDQEGQGDTEIENDNGSEVKIHVKRV